MIKLPINLTSWNVLYYRLRANFDGLRSEYCSDPPEPGDNKGRAIFELGKRCTNVTDGDQLITIEYDDLINGGSGRYQADLVIAADGANSIVRECLIPKPPKVYSGYVAWRGTVPEHEVSEATRRIFDKHFCGFPYHRGHILG